MTSTTPETATRATSAEVAEGALTVHLDDGRVLSVPLDWFPRLLHGTPEERSRCRLIGGGVGLHWPELDEDISVEGLLRGSPSGESPRSLQRWMAARGGSDPVTD